MARISHFTIAIGSSLLAAAFAFSPEGVRGQLRTGLVDMMRPGIDLTQQLHLLALVNRPDHRQSDSAELLATVQGELRDAQMEIARLKETIPAVGPLQRAGYGVPKASQLLAATLLEVPVLGDTLASEWRRGKLIAAGKNVELREQAYILKSNGPLLAAGRDQALSPEDPLLRGRVIIGRVDQVGRRTSSFSLVTSDRYRGLAQLLRPSSQGFVFGAKAVLRGTGAETCRLEGIPATEVVAVGDAVYSADRDGIVSVPFYYGDVVEAFIKPEDREWTVIVRPAMSNDSLTNVVVVRTSPFSSQRLLAD